MSSYGLRRPLVMPSRCVFTDQVLHGALAGQHAFEQTFLLDVEVMREPTRSPLRILEHLAERKLT
jgi:hypothetical protein